MSDIDQLLDDLHQLRNEFGAVEDAYRQSRVDVAIAQLEECNDVKEEYIAADMWGDDYPFTEPDTDE